MFPPRFVCIVGRKQQQQLRLEWIGILKFVDENAPEAFLKVAPHVVIVLDQVARTDEQVEEVQRAFALL